MRTLLAVIFVLIANICNAQNIGFRAGVNSANVKPIRIGISGAAAVTINGEPVMGINLGVHTFVPIGENFLFRPQLMYSGQGFEAKEERDALGNVMLERVSASMNYLLLPVEVGYYFLLNKTNLSISTGPYFGYLVGGKIKTNNGERKLTSNDFDRIDLGLKGSLEFALHKGFYIGSSYQSGLTDVTRGGAKSKNHVVQFYLGYYFGKHPIRGRFDKKVNVQ
jgi:hypothetical protein